MSTKVRYPVGKCWIEVEAQSVKEALQAVCEYAQVFGECQCGLCGSDKVMPCHRVAKGYEFYSMECLGCGAQLSFGQTKEGGRLFPKRKDQNGYEVGKHGWHQYQQESGGF